MATGVEKKRLTITELFQKKETEKSERVEDRLNREKEEMLAVIIQKNLQIKNLKQDIDRLESKLAEKEETLKRFQESHSKLLWEISKKQKERWLIHSQVTKERNKKKDGSSDTWQQVQESITKRERNF